MNDIYHSLLDFYAAVKAAHTPITDAAPTLTEADPFADLKAAVAQDADWREDDHPRGGKGSGHGGEFTIKPETISREDTHNAPAAIGASLERGLVDIVKAAGPHGTSAKADVFKEFGKPVAAIRLVKNDRERFSAAEMKAMIDALQRAGCSDVEEVRDTERPHETAIFCTPPIDPSTAAAEYMAEVEKSVGGSNRGGSYTPSDEAKESAAAMAKNKDEKNPAKRIKVDFQEWTLESAQREEPSATGTEEDETDGKVFDSPEAAAKWLLDTKNAGGLEGDDAWYSSVSGKDGTWKTYRLTPVNFTEQEILDIEKIVSKGKKED